MKSSLKWLCQKYLSREIQKGHGTTGHSSVEDAKAVLDLVGQKCEKGPLWGTWQAAHEPIFKRMKRSAGNEALSRSGGRGLSERQGCIIDWGSPGSSYGKMADYAIGCGDDTEVVAAVSRATNGDETGEYIPAKGVAFTWARLRGLESARDFRDDIPRHASDISNRHTDGEGPGQQETLLVTMASAVSTTVSHIKAIHAALPPRTLLIVYSGTADPRPFRLLGQRKRRYHRMMKDGVKWEDMAPEERWDDDRDQEMKAAVGRARIGVGFLGFSAEEGGVAVG